MAATLPASTSAPSLRERSAPTTPRTPPRRALGRRSVLLPGPRRRLAHAGAAGRHHHLAGDRCRPGDREIRPGLPLVTEWDPVQEKFGGLVMIYGTLMTSFIALLIAVPVSFGIALFLTEMSPGWLKRPLGIAIELLAAVPSIVYGMWGLLVFGPILSTYVQQPLQSACSRACPSWRPWSRARRWASASCRPASSWRSW
jgi:hypothetical protein